MNQKDRQDHFVVDARQVGCKDVGVRHPHDQPRGADNLHPDTGICVRELSLVGTADVNSCDYFRVEAALLDPTDLLDTSTYYDVRRTHLLAELHLGRVTLAAKEINRVFASGI
ncbi:TPA: hypothetical protein EYN98_28595 [Candidatus Poribacteria bacterium]|nr:hypothetical protein [Candidatus Poribacteria bacterium]